MTTVAGLHFDAIMKKYMLKDCRNMGMKEDVIRLVEAQIAGCVDLSPEEMVDAAFIMVEQINKKMNSYSEEIEQEATEIQLR
jgi:hypothetical protein